MKGRKTRTQNPCGSRTGKDYRTRSREENYPPPRGEEGGQEGDKEVLGGKLKVELGNQAGGEIWLPPRAPG